MLAFVSFRPGRPSCLQPWAFHEPHSTSKNSRKIRLAQNGEFRENIYWVLLYARGPDASRGHDAMSYLSHWSREGIAKKLANDAPHLPIPRVRLILTSRGLRRQREPAKRYVKQDRAISLFPCCDNISRNTFQKNSQNSQKFPKPNCLSTLLAVGIHKIPKIPTMKSIRPTQSDSAPVFMGIMRVR